MRPGGPAESLDLGVRVDGMWTNEERQRAVRHWAALILMGFFGSPLAAQEGAVPRFEVLPDSVPFPVSLPASFRSTVGYLVVPENREATVSREIRLPVAIVHAARPDTLGPVLYLSGGPGTSALSAAQYPGAYPWTAERDFVVLGQRGTHYAEPALMCPEYSEALDAVASIDAPSEALRLKVRGATACRERLGRAGVDVGGYHSAAIAADAADLRRVLGLKPWTIYAVSYGTRVALAMARDHPASVRAMVLDSPLPPHVRYDDQSTENLAAALQAVAADCAAESACRSAFPSLWDRFTRTIRQLSQASVAVGILDLSTSDAVRSVPRLMNAIAVRDSAVMATLARETSAPNSFAWGMRMSVWCGEALPFSQRAGGVVPDVFGGMESAVFPPEVCRAWGVPARDRREVLPVVSETPTLVLAGEFDPETPPKWAYSTAESLSRSVVVIVPGAGHGVSQEWGGDGCAMRLANQFVANPIAALDVLHAGNTCASARSRPEYLLTVRD